MKIADQPIRPDPTRVRGMWRFGRGLRATLAVLGAAALISACGTASHPAPTHRLGSATVAHAISVIAPATKMICAAEAQREIGSTLGVKTDTPPKATWSHQRYSCTYIYATGRMTLSVKQLDDAASTHRYYESLAARLHRRQSLTGIGQGSFTTANGSVVVVKDDKILLVDVHNLAAMFGVPPDTRANAAISVAATIMGCWTEQ